MTNELVHFRSSDGVATVTLDSPANRNALSTALVGDLLGALDRAERGVADGSVRVVVVDHTPPVFCAGADLKERRAGPADSSGVVRALRWLMEAPVPTIAALAGPARAGGLGLMAACDLVVVQSDVTFALTEVRIGVAAAIISVPILRRCQRVEAGGGVPHRRDVLRLRRSRRRPGHPHHGRRRGHGHGAVRGRAPRCARRGARHQGAAARQRIR